MIKLRGTGTIYYSDVEKAYKKYPNEEIIIVIPNTKEQSVEELERISYGFPNIKFSVTGGLDPSKSKFNNEQYQKRTYFSARELCEIIKIYRKIEKKINLDWTETQKAMYVYMKLCNKMQYSEIKVNGRDYARGIGGLLYNKAVCSGFAMIYKEALDRLGIECYYQNREGHHSWVIAKLDGKYRALELTWDAYSKGAEGCEFKYFNRKGSNFYQNEHHDIKDEREEREFPITEYTDEELTKDLKAISSPYFTRVPVPKNQRDFSVKVKINGIPCEIDKNSNGILTFKCLGKEVKYQSKVYARQDGSSFVLVKVPSKETKLYKFVIIEETEDVLQVGKIFSEEDLVLIPKEYDKIVANGLISRERLKRKIDNFNGYVGYVGKNKGIYYDSNFERKTLNVIR